MTNLVLSLPVTGEGEGTMYSIKDKYLHVVTSLLFTKERSKDALYFFPISLNFTQQTSILLLSYATEKKYKKPLTPGKVNIITVQDFRTRNTRYIGHSESNS